VFFFVLFYFLINFFVACQVSVVSRGSGTVTWQWQCHLSSSVSRIIVLYSIWFLYLLSSFILVTVFTILIHNKFITNLLWICSRIYNKFLKKINYSENSLIYFITNWSKSKDERRKLWCQFYQRIIKTSHFRQIHYWWKSMIKMLNFWH